MGIISQLITMGAPPCIKNGWIFHGELLNNQMVASGKLRVCHLEAMAIDLDRGFTQKMVDLPIVFLYVYHRVFRIPKKT